MRTTGVIILEVVAKYTPLVTLINNNDVIKTISANGANDALNIRILPRTTGCCDHVLDIQTVKQRLNFAIFSIHCYQLEYGIPLLNKDIANILVNIEAVIWIPFDAVRQRSVLISVHLS